MEFANRDRELAQFLVRVAETHVDLA
jgi:hypothetical protein